MKAKRLHVLLVIAIGLLNSPLNAGIDSHQIRLVNGTTRCSGRVEVLHEGQWGSVCDDHWGIQEAEVVCREMKCGTALGVKHTAYFGQGAGPILLDDLRCNGQERALGECDHAGFGVNNCGHSEDAGVECSDVPLNVKLFNGTDRCNGRLEVEHEGQWVKICKNSHWGDKEESLVCRELECGTPDKKDVRLNIGAGTNLGSFTASCVGAETSIAACPLQSNLSACEAAVVYCTDAAPMRLVNGSTSCSGRVEVFYRDHWGTVCDDGWTMRNAEVVCNSLDCGTALEIKPRAFYGQGKGLIWLDDLRCTGQETSLSKCKHSGLSIHNCGHGEDVGVVCSDHIKLLNGTRCEGRIEVKHGDQWRKLCSSGWSQKEHEVLCQELKCGTPLTGQDMPDFGDRIAPIGVKARCLGNETSFIECEINETADTCDSASLLCANSKQIRLVNGTTRCSGRVEVLHEGQWGSVCGDGWGLQEAEVACREMKCGTALGVKYQAHFGQGAGPILLDNLGCNGQERALGECKHAGFGVTNCGHPEDAGVLCSEKVKLFNGTDRCNGRLEVEHEGQWVKICKNSHWGNKEESLVCRELECGTPDKKAVRLNIGASSNRGNFTASCVGAETSIAACPLQSNPSACEAAVVYCTGQPDIKLVNGADRCSGRVEVQNDGQWGTVCDDSWDIRDAEVACRAMDCGTPLLIKPAANYGPGRGNVWLDDLECFGNETSLMQCKRRHFGLSRCNHMEDAGVQCSISTRLLNGSNHCSGRVEIHQEGHWAPVFNANWGLNEALVVCREMQCGEPVVASTPFNFGHAGQATGYTTTCNGRETSISQCSLRGYAQTSQNHAAAATVVCSGNVRLVNESNKCTGRVELYQNGQWGSVCDETWDMNDAAVVCMYLQCGRAQKIPNSGFFGRGSTNMLIGEISCTGREHSPDECRQQNIGSSTCNSTSVAGLLCSDGLPTRLVHSTGQCFGRVEVQHAGQWGTLCGKDWSMSDAMVVCSLLGCGKAASISGNAQFEQGTGPIWEASDLCFNNEASVFKCSQSGFNGTSCGHRQDAGVVCTESIRLVNGRSECSGRLEISHNGQWGTICDDTWKMSNTEVVCRQMGCGHGLSFGGFGAGSGPIWLDDVVCTGEEDAITQCSHQNYGENNCGHSEDVGIVCSGKLAKPHVSLNPGPEVNFGDRVEITCSVEMTDHLGGMFVLQKTPGPFRMQRYSVSETETFTIPKTNLSHGGLYHCLFQKKIPSRTIDMLGDPVELKVTVKLQQPIISLPSGGPMMLMPTNKIEVKGGSTFSISCSIFSKYEGGSFYLRKSNTTATKHQESLSHSIIQVASFDFSEVTPQDQGDYTCVYSINISTQSFHSVPSKTIQVIVSVKLQQPIISLPSGGPMMLVPTNKIEVKGGSTFAISCFIFSKYEGGTFYLRKTNTNATKLQAALSHSIIQAASFDFSDVTTQDQGDYTCVYSINISTQSFHSVPSKTIQVTVSGSDVPSTMRRTMVGLALVLILSTVVYLCWRRRRMASRAMVHKGQLLSSPTTIWRVMPPKT
ncbi:deleted in malignant brain tumors 1 protein-like isoform X3 [Gadus macrocephalus]|uniref:deleted in malignant brain tumors 1 protein-like isoform X3 n=1 Tax=Gadus macrocephalus TaxID=80720 RepID=UPI0028CB81E5|nr:deleted in malignant brain tumors 1 protein-like isoform X3 [Gadus macrocephalus]